VTWDRTARCGSQRPDRADDARLAGRGGTREIGGGAVDLLRLIGQAVAAQLQRIRAERVGLEDFGTRPDVLRMHFLHQPRLLEVELIVADVEEEAFGVQHRAHGPVEDVDAAVIQQGSEGGSHKGK